MDPMTTPPARAYGRSTSPQVADQGFPRAVLVPTGAVEQHGPHLPLGVDTWLAIELCHRVSARLGDSLAVTVAEPVSYGCSWHHTSFAGTVSLRTSTFISLLTDVCASLHADGHQVIIVNGHGGNRGPIQTAAADLASEGVPTWSVSYFELLGDVAMHLFDDRDAVGHACAMETSMMLSLWPELVHTDDVPTGPTPPGWPNQHLFNSDPVRTVRSFDTINPTGVIGRPELARVEAGQELVEAATQRLAETVEKVLDAASSTSDSR